MSGTPQGTQARHSPGDLIRKAASEAGIRAGDPMAPLLGAFAVLADHLNATVARMERIGTQPLDALFTREFFQMLVERLVAEFEPYLRRRTIAEQALTALKMLAVASVGCLPPALWAYQLGRSHAGAEHRASDAALLKVYERGPEVAAQWSRLIQANDLHRWIERCREPGNLIRDGHGTYCRIALHYPFKPPPRLFIE